jgi:hypothetical protein
MTRTREQIERRIAELTAQQSRGSEITEHFHLGWVGTGGKPAQRLNQRKSRELERTIDRSVELIELERELEHLIAHEHASERQAKREAKEAAHLQAIEEKLKKARPGDEIVLLFGSRATIKRINKKSVTGLGGTRYTISQIADIIPEAR